MIFRTRTPVGLLAVVTDATARQATVLDVDAIGLLSIVINSYTGVAQFALGFGGVDPGERFHLDPKRPVVHVAFNRREEPALFDVFFLDKDGNPRSDYDPPFFLTLAREVLFPMAYRISWGEPYPDIEVLYAGVTIFRHVPPEPEPEPVTLAPSTEKRPFPPPAPPE
jgi:hypothetical protein